MGTRVYIGRLSYQAREKDVERFFRGYGRISDIMLKNGYGFIVSIQIVMFFYCIYILILILFLFVNCSYFFIEYSMCVYYSIFSTCTHMLASSHIAGKHLSAYLFFSAQHVLAHLLVLCVAYPMNTLCLVVYKQTENCINIV